MKSKDLRHNNDVSKNKSHIRENIEAILIAVLLALFIRAFIVQAFKIPSGSMKQTLLIGDQILVNKFIYGVKMPFTGITLIPLKTPKHGDIVVFKYPEDPEKDFIKRVIAIQGDKVEIKDKRLYVNNQLQTHDFALYTSPHIIPSGLGPRDNYGPVTVPENSIFVMGDNRDSSLDSRFWGFVNLKAVKGKAFMIYWSWGQNGVGMRWSRLTKILK